MDNKTKAIAAKKASIRLAAVSGDMKNRALAGVVDSIKQHREQIFAANRADLKRAREEDLAGPLLKRLRFDDQKLMEACEGLESLIGLADPVGITLCATELDPGLELYKMSCPIGVIGVIFESRPDALVQISCLCLKSGNSVLLKGGREAADTNRVLAEIIREASVGAGIPEG